MVIVLSSRWGVFRVPGRPVFPGGPAGYSRESTPDGGAHYMESYRDVNGKSNTIYLFITNSTTPTYNGCVLFYVYNQITFPIPNQYTKSLDARHSTNL